MRFFPALQAAAPADGRFGLIADPPPSDPYTGTLTLMALVGAATFVPFLVGRWRGRRSGKTGRGLGDGASLLAAALAIPSYYCLYRAMLRDDLSSPLFWTLGVLVAAAGLSFIAGFRGGLAGGVRLGARLGLAWPIAALMLFPLEPNLVPEAMALGLAVSAAADVSAAQRGFVLPSGWNRAQAIYSLLAIPPTWLLVFGASPYWIG